MLAPNADPGENIEIMHANINKADSAVDAAKKQILPLSALENIPAIVHITQSSQELGNELADGLFGSVSPAGKLVQIWTKSIDELLRYWDTDSQAFVLEKGKLTTSSELPPWMNA